LINTFEPKLVGNTLSMTTKFYDADNNEIVPDSVTLKYKKPNSTVNSIAISRVDNKYSSSVFLDLSGMWYFRWESSGNYASAEEFSVNVHASSLD
jgi:hypothetical protein